MNKTDLIDRIVNVLEAKMEAGMSPEGKKKIRSLRKDPAAPKKPDPMAQGQAGSVKAMADKPRNQRGARFGNFLTSKLMRKESTENFITRTVGLLVDRLNEQDVKPSLAQRAVAAAKKRPGATVTKTDGGREVIEAPPKNPKKQTTLLATDKKGGVTVDTGKKTRDLASHQNFIGKTVEILAEKLTGNQKKLDVNKSGKLDAQDFKMLRSGKKKGK